MQRKEAFSASDDDRLGQALARGETVSLDEIYRVYKPRVRGVCRRYLRDPRDVEEAVQDTFVKAYRGLARFNGSFRLGAWLSRIAANAAIDVARRNQRRPELTALADEDVRELVSSPEQELVGDPTPVDEVLRRMRPDHVRALHLRGVEGASHVELGDALGKSPQQVKALLHRARESFRRVWQELGGGAALGTLAGALGLWRIYRAAVSASPALGRIQTSGTWDAVAAPAAAVADLWPWA